MGKALSKELVIGVGLVACVSAGAGGIGTWYILKKQTVKNRNNNRNEALGNGDGFAGKEDNIKPVISKKERNSLCSNDLEVDFDVTEPIIDGVILHASEDNAIVLQFIANMKREFPDLKLKFQSRDEMVSPGQSIFGGSEQIFEQSRFLLVFMTNNLKNDRLELFFKDIHLKETITEEEKYNRLIPVEVECGVNLQSLCGLEALKYFEYLEGNRDGFCKKFQKLITNGRRMYLLF